MSGGEVLPTDELFVYKPSKTVLNNTPAVVQETLRFNYRFDTDVRQRFFCIDIKIEFDFDCSHPYDIKRRQSDQMF